jgi:hypothetical protein
MQPIPLLLTDQRQEGQRLVYFYKLGKRAGRGATNKKEDFLLAPRPLLFTFLLQASKKTKAKGSKNN